MGTIWKSDGRKFGKLNGDVECDVTVIGGGVAGLWCAYKLVKAGKSVVLLEAKRVGSGVTAGSTAILTYAQDVIYQPLIKKHGEDVARKYLADTREAIAAIKKINCDMEATEYVLFSVKGKGKRALKKERAAYEKLGVKVSEAKDVGLPYKVKYALRFGDSYQFNPLKLCDWLAGEIVKKGGKIFEGKRVVNAPDGQTLNVGDYTVTAKNFVVATHFPFINKVGLFWLKMWQDMNYCMAFRAKDDFCVGRSYESIDKTGFEYRRVGSDILVDGVSVRVGAKPYRSKYRVIQEHIEKHFGRVKETARYVAQDVITMDKLPYAGLYSHFADNVYVVTGFNKWGMTNAWICARVVTDMILGKGEKKNIYSPQRVVLFKNPLETFEHVGVVAASFANDLLNLDAKKFKRIGIGQGAVIRHKGHRVGASRDKDGKVRLISGICPHMGCNLKWNKDERTFDCPCHGSRFDTKGEIINGPATCKGSCLQCKKECRVQGD